MATRHIGLHQIQQGGNRGISNGGQAAAKAVTVDGLAERLDLNAKFPFTGLNLDRIKGLFSFKVGGQILKSAFQAGAVRQWVKKRRIEKQVKQQRMMAKLVAKVR